MLKPGDVCELKEAVKPTINRDGEPIRLLLESFTVGCPDMVRGVIYVHRMGVKAEIPSEVFMYYHVVGSVGEYPEKKLDEKLDKIRARWKSQLGDRIPEDSEVLEHIDGLNEAMAGLIPSALGVYYYRFSGVYMDDKKKVPMVRLKWIPPAPGQSTAERSHREDAQNQTEDESNQFESGVKPESGSQGEASPEGSEGEAGVHTPNGAG